MNPNDDWKVALTEAVAALLASILIGALILLLIAKFC